VSVLSIIVPSSREVMLDLLLVATKQLFTLSTSIRSVDDDVN
jgi:hypothetical protein